MTKFLQGFTAAIFIITAVGCQSLLNNNNGVFGKAQATNNKIDTAIHKTEKAQADTDKQKLAMIGAYAQGGVDYSLGKVTNAPPEVTVAKEMNQRVEALAGKPDFNEMKEIQNIVDELLTQVDKTRLDGEKALAQKDKQIETIQNNALALDAQRESQISTALAQANQNAQKADQYQTTLKQMDSWGGLGAVFYGLKEFVVRAAWVLGIGSVLFLILRLLASSNPIASAIFSIFDQMGSWAIHTISLLFPKALAIAGNVSTEIYNTTKGALTSIVDSVETVKLQAQASGQPATIEDLLNTAEASMTPTDKAIIEKIKLELGWVKPATTPTVVPQTTPSIPVVATVVTPPAVPVSTPVVTTTAAVTTGTVVVPTVPAQTTDISKTSAQ